MMESDHLVVAPCLVHVDLKDLACTWPTPLESHGATMAAQLAKPSRQPNRDRKIKDAGDELQGAGQGGRKNVSYSPRSCLLSKDCL